MTSLKRALVAAGFTFCTACTSSPIIRSVAVQAGMEAVEGIPYFLPLAEIPVLVEMNQNKFTITLQLAEYRIDPEAPLMARINYSVWADDTVSIETTDQLLSLTTVTSEDQTDEIVSAVRASVTANLQGADSQGLRTHDDKEMKVLKPGLYRLDPLQPLREHGREILEAAGQGAWVDLHWHAGGASIIYLDHGFAARYLDSNRSRIATCDTSLSLCFPYLMPVVIRLIAEGTEIEKTYVIPDPTRSFGISLNRRGCIRSSYTINIMQGVMTKFDVTKPSELAGCLSIPLQILSAIISAPVDAIRGQTAEIEAQTLLIEAQTGLIAARNAGTQSE